MSDVPSHFLVMLSVPDQKAVIEQLHPWVVEADGMLRGPAGGQAQFTYFPERSQGVIHGENLGPLTTHLGTKAADVEEALRALWVTPVPPLGVPRYEMNLVAAFPLFFPEPDPRAGDVLEHLLRGPKDTPSRAARIWATLVTLENLKWPELYVRLQGALTELRDQSEAPMLRLKAAMVLDVLQGAQVPKLD
jgi:hypothetical protein